MKVVLSLATVILLASGAVGRADVGVDLELVLAIDSSGSVDFGEFELQVRGIARAFGDPEVIEAIEGGAPNGIAVSVIQWSGRRQHLVTIDWTRITDAASAQALAARVDAMGRVLIGETAIADALRFASEQLAYGPFQGTRQIIDVSGDGPTNAGGDPDPLRDAAALAGITINGLAILNEVPRLRSLLRRARDRRARRLHHGGQELRRLRPRDPPQAAARDSRRAAGRGTAASVGRGPRTAGHGERRDTVTPGVPIPASASAPLAVPGAAAIRLALPAAPGRDAAGRATMGRDG